MDFSSEATQIVCPAMSVNSLTAVRDVVLKQYGLLTSLYAKTILPVLCSVAWKVKLPRL